MPSARRCAWVCCQNLRAFAHAEVSGLIKAGVEEKGLLLAREAGLAH
jgi:hypothetical protein